MKKKRYSYFLGMCVLVLCLFSGCHSDMRTDTAAIQDSIAGAVNKGESEEETEEDGQKAPIPLPVLEAKEMTDEFLIPLTDEAVDSLESVSCAIVGWDEDKYYPILYGREIFLDENHVAHISKDQSIVTLFFSETDQSLPLTKMYESWDGDGSRTWYSKNFSISGTGDVDEYYHVDLNLSEVGVSDYENDFLDYTLTPTSNKIYNPVMEKVAYKYWNYVHSSKDYLSEIRDEGGRMIPATEWAGPGLYMEFFPYSGCVDELKFQLTSLHEIPGTYYCQLILELKDGRVTASDLMLLQKDEGDSFAITTYPDLAEMIEVNTEQGILYFQVYDNYAVLGKYWGEDNSLDVPEKVNDVYVTEIGQEAFANNSTLQKVHLPSEITKIDKWAFYETNLAEIHLPDKLEYIGYEAFGNQGYDILMDALLGENTKGGIESVHIGKNVIWIDDGAFSGYCIRNFEVDSSNPYYQSKDGVIYSKDQTCLLVCPTGKNEVFQVPDGVVKVSPDAFQNNGLYSEMVLDSYGIVSIILPDSVQIFACDQWPKHLEALAVGKGLEEWNYQSLCQVLSELKISEDNPNFKEENGLLYNGDKSKLLYYPRIGAEDVIYLPGGLQGISDNAFVLGYDSIVTEVHIPEGVLTIGDWNFSYIDKQDAWDAVHVYLPDSLEEISERAFWKSPGIVIHASEDSYGASFAEENQIQLEVEER